MDHLSTSSHLFSQKSERRIDPIRLFFESVDPPDAKKGYKYFRCFHGNNKIVSITPGANGNLKSM